MKKIEINNYLKFSPLLIIYLIICLIKQQNVLVGDEGRYLLYASNLLNGFYASPQYNEYSFLWNGPGYPLFLTPFVYLKTSLLIPKLFNAVFLYLGIIFFYKSLLFFITNKKAFFISLILGLYYPLLRDSLPRILTEAIAFFLVSFFVYHCLFYLKKTNKKSFWYASIALGFLVLTKVIFGYILIGSFIILLTSFFIIKKSPIIKKYLLILLLGFFITTPYLIYTYNITNKLLYFGNSGGMSLYWMSTPFEEELGDWHFFETLHEKPNIAHNHMDFINAIKNAVPVEKNQLLQKKAIENISDNKFKYFKNWISNLGRIFFDYPYTNQQPTNRPLFYILPNTLLVIGLLLSIFINIAKFKQFDISILLIALFSVLYIGGISLLSSYNRFIFPILPLLLIWMSYTLDKYLIFKINLFSLKK